MSRRQRMRSPSISNARNDAPSPSGDSTRNQYSLMKPTGIGKESGARTRTPIYNIVQRCGDEGSGEAEQRTVSQLSVPLSAIRSVESSRGSKDLMMPSKQLTSMMLISDGINTTRDKEEMENTGLRLSMNQKQEEIDTYRSNNEPNVDQIQEASLQIHKSNDSPIRLTGGSRD